MQTFAINHERYHVDGIAIAMLGAAMLIDSASRGRVKQSTPRARRTTALVCVALAVSLVVGNIAAAVRVGTHPGKSWVDNLTADLERRGTVTVLDANPPVRVMPPVWWGTDARLARMLSPLTEVTFGRPAAELSMVDDDGHLRQVVVGDASHALPGPVEGCGYALGAGQTATARMTEELYSWEWVVQVDTVAGEGGTLTVGMADASATFDVAKGVTRHQFALTGPVPSTVTLSVAKDSPTLCVSQVIAGPAGPQE
jgi:hypothetical protein